VRLLLTTLVVGWAALFGAWPAFAQKKVALVIAVSEYESGSVLKQTVDDAEKIHTALLAVGFTDVPPVLKNPTKALLDAALLDFSKRSEDADVALLYYSGHGMQYSEDNWLIPADASLQAESHIRLQGIRLRDIIELMAPAKFRMLFLDACRNNPFEVNWQQQRSDAQGMANIPAELMPDGTMVAYAAAAGQRTPDNGAYASALAKWMQVEGLVLEQVMARVRTELRLVVPTASPEVIASYSGTFSFQSGYDPRPVDQRGGLDADTQRWIDITGGSQRGPESCGAYEQYAKDFPEGRFLARATRLLTTSPCIELLRARARLTDDIQQSSDACAELTALVYFNNDATSLTPDAAKVLEDAAERANRCEILRVTIEAHEDYGPSVEAALTISERRAAAVLDFLVSMGLDNRKVTTLPFGVSQPLEKGIPNPGNRRAVVRFEMSDPK
jgi:outer membrane protein OmpA-like peptidoglycan-associated protein